MEQQSNRAQPQCTRRESGAGLKADGTLSMNVLRYAHDGICTASALQAKHERIQACAQEQASLKLRCSRKASQAFTQAVAA